MATIKQKSLKPATNSPEAQGILVYNGTGAAIPANALVYIIGVNGANLSVALADSNASNWTAKSSMFITKHRIPDTKRGVILPWKIIDFDCSQGSAAAGTFIYLHEDPTDTSVTSPAGGYKLSAGTTNTRVVGIFLNALAVAAGGKALIDPSGMLGVSAL